MADDSENIEGTEHAAEELPPLNAKEERFCEEYIIDFNGTRALYRAGCYNPKNRVTARSMAYELLQKPKIQARIEELKKERSERTRVSADRVLEELAVLGFSSIQHYAVTDGGQVTLAPGAPSSAARAVQRVKRKRIRYENENYSTVDTTVEIRLHDKGAALRALLDHVEPKAKHVELTGPGGGPIQHVNVTLYMPDNRRGGPQAEGEDKS